MEYHFVIDGKNYVVKDAESREAAQAMALEAAGPSQAEIEKQQANSRWIDQIDLSPTQARDRRKNIVMGVDRFPEEVPLPTRTQENPDMQLKLENAASQGVDTTTGLNAGPRAVAGLLAFDRKSQMSNLEKMLREEYKDMELPDGVPLVFQDESTGLPVYMRRTPQGKLKPTLINVPGVDMGDFAEFFGELPTIAMETVGGVGGAIAGSAASPGAGTVAGGTAGAALFGAASIPVRVGLARMAGADPEILEQISMGNEMAFQAAMSGGGELFGFVADRAVSGMRNFFGRGLEAADLPALESEIKRRLAEVDKLEARRAASGGDMKHRIELTLGELTGDPDLITAEANMMSNQIGPAAAQMRGRIIRSDKAARQALRDVATHDVRAPGTPGFLEETSEATRDVLVGRPMDEANRGVVEATDNLDFVTRAERLDSSLDELARVRDNIHARAEVLHDAEGIAWANYRDAVGWDPQLRQSYVMVDNRGDTPIREVARRLQADQKQALLGNLRNAYRGSLENMGFSPEQADMMVSNNELAGLAQETLDPFHLHMALSSMKRELRAINAGVNPNKWEATDLSDIIEAIELTMQQAPMVNPRGQAMPARTAMVRAAWDEANLRTRKLHEVLDTKNMRFLLETRMRIGPDGTSYDMPNVPPGLIRKRLLVEGDARMMQEAVAATGYDLRTMNALGAELKRLHADMAIPGGKWSQTGHNKFMMEYEDHLRVLGIDEPISNAAHLGRVLDEKSRGLEMLEKRLGEAYGRTVADPAKPFNVANEVLSDRMSYKQVKKVMDDLDKLDPRTAQAVREEVLNKLDFDLTSSNNMLMNSGKVGEVLRTQRKTLAAMFGEQYVRDLDQLHKVLGYMDERSFRKATKQLMQTPFIAITRSLFGPLSKKQRFLTAVQRVARNQRAGSVNELLRQPGALRQFIRLKDLSVRDPRYWVTVRGLGLLEYALDGDDDAQQAYQDFMDGTLRQEMIERQTPKRYGSIQ